MRMGGSFKQARILGGAGNKQKLFNFPLKLKKVENWKFKFKYCQVSEIWIRRLTKFQFQVWIVSYFTLVTLEKLVLESSEGQLFILDFEVKNWVKF